MRWHASRRGGGQQCGPPSIGHGLPWGQMALRLLSQTLAARLLENDLRFSLSLLCMHLNHSLCVGTLRHTLTLANLHAGLAPSQSHRAVHLYI